MRSGSAAIASVDAELRVELVDRAVGLDPRVRLGHAPHVAEVGLPAVAEPRVDAREIDRHDRSRPRYHSARTGSVVQGSRCESGADPPL